MPKYCQTLYIAAQRVSRRSFTPYLAISFREDLFLKLSEKLHERVNRLTMSRLIAA